MCVVFSFFICPTPLLFVGYVGQLVVVVAPRPLYVRVPAFSFALLRWWHGLHIAWNGPRQKLPPCDTGVMWSTTVAAQPHTTHVGLCARYVLRSCFHLYVQYRLSCLRLAYGRADDFTYKGRVFVLFMCATSIQVFCDVIQSLVVQRAVSHVALIHYDLSTFIDVGVVSL